MVKKHDDVTIKPLPSPTTPWLVILCLLAGIALMYLGFLRPAERLLGTPLHRNEYLQQLTPPKAQAAPPPVPPAPAQPDAPTTPTTPAATPAPPPLDSERVIGE